MRAQKVNINYYQRIQGIEFSHEGSGDPPRAFTQEGRHLTRHGITRHRREEELVWSTLRLEATRKVLPSPGERSQGAEELRQMSRYLGGRMVMSWKWADAQAE